MICNETMSSKHPPPLLQHSFPPPCNHLFCGSACDAHNGAASAVPCPPSPQTYYIVQLDQYVQLANYSGCGETLTVRGVGGWEPGP